MFLYSCLETNFFLFFQQLTPEDEDRRRRRRERNKIAATKCRMKKRERTLNLVSESEILETQNIELKSQVRSLETERRKLTEMLQAHGATCIRQEGFQPPSRCTIPISKYVPDLITCDQQSNRNQQHNKTLPPIPPMNTIKFCHSLKPAPTQNSDHSQPLPDIGYCKSGLSPIYCKSSPSDRYTLSPDSGFIKSPSDMGMYNGMPMKSDYIPNGENNDGDVSEFALKCELIDASPYTTVQSADRFLFDGGHDNFDSDISASRNLKILNNNNNNNNHLTTTTTVIEFNSSCQSFVESHLLKADFLSHNPELLMDGTETQFTDLDSGVTTYNSIANNANNNSNNSGCMA